jgi:FAD synthetase
VVTKLQFEILKQIFCYWVLENQAIPITSFELFISEKKFKQELSILLRKELIQIIEDNEIRYLITDKGKSKFKVVLTGGAYDLLHRGHLSTLAESASLGDVLIVVVARDKTIRKGKREPIHNELDRVFLLNSLKIVDAAVIGDPIDHFKVVRKIKPDIIALGSDQFHLEENLEQQLYSIGLKSTVVTRLTADYEGLATTRVIEDIIERNNH